MLKYAVVFKKSKSALMKRFFSRSLLVSSLVFVLMQGMSLVHAAVHPFHEHGEVCDWIDHAAQPTTLSADDPLASVVSFAPILSLADYQAWWFSAIYPPFHQRAPPF